MKTRKTETVLVEVKTGNLEPPDDRAGWKITAMNTVVVPADGIQYPYDGIQYPYVLTRVLWQRGE